MKLIILFGLLLCHSLSTEARLTKTAAENGNDSVKEQYVRDWEGEAGLYRVVRQNSLARWIEADHVPPKSVYKCLPESADPKNPRNLSDNDMPAILVRRKTHSGMTTTGNSKGNQEFRRLLCEDLERDKEIYLGIWANIEAYDQLGYLTDNDQLKRGLVSLLDQHVAIGTISDVDRQSIISVNHLD